MRNNGDGKIFGLDALVRRIFKRGNSYATKLPPGIHEIYPGVYLFRQPVTEEQRRVHIEGLRAKQRYLTKGTGYKR